MAKYLLSVAAVFLWGIFAAPWSSGAQSHPKISKPIDEQTEEMDIISMSQSADEFVPAPNHEYFFSAEELQELRQESPLEWDIQTRGKPLEIPNFLKTALDTESDTQSE